MSSISPMLPNVNPNYIPDACDMVSPLVGCNVNEYVFGDTYTPQTPVNPAPNGQQTPPAQNPMPPVQGSVPPMQNPTPANPVKSNQSSLMGLVAFGALAVGAFFGIKHIGKLPSRVPASGAIKGKLARFGASLKTKFSNIKTSMANGLNKLVAKFKKVPQPRP